MPGDWIDHAGHEKQGIGPYGWSELAGTPAWKARLSVEVDSHTATMELFIALELGPVRWHVFD